MAKKAKAEVNLSTEAKIKEAAERVFVKKGYAAARTRDIAEEAGINLALLNYYFRSKEKLFELVMLEKLAKFFGVLAPTLNDTNTTIEQKITAIAGNYIDLITIFPDLPVFILSEVRNNPEQFVQKLPVGKVIESHFIRQIQEKQPGINPLHFLMNVLGLTVFPFLMKPIFQAAGVINEKTFALRMDERKILIPKWTNAMLKVK